MLRFVTKSDYWDLEDSGRLSELRPHSFWHLKSAQDAMALKFLEDHVSPAAGARIGEVGGGDSRILPILSDRGNNCFNFEPFAGEHGGPAKEVAIQGVENVRTLVGESDGSFAAGTLDAVFSVSVVEHVLPDGLGPFFQDCHRLLKPGGFMVHLIDMYLVDQFANEHRYREELNVKLMRRYGAVFDEFFVPIGTVLDPESASVEFRCSYATNPDPVMAIWNRAVPALRQLRTVAQSTAVVLAGHAAN